MQKSYEKVINILKVYNKLDFENSFAILKICNILLNNEVYEGKGRDLVIRVLDGWDKIHPATYDAWNDVVEAAGLQPYVQYELLTGAACIRHEYFKSKALKDVYFHEEQMKLSMLLNASKSIIVSAPTSFGKSLLIEEIVSTLRYKNIVIIQPTLALLDETRKKFQKYRDIYDIIISTSQQPTQDCNLFLFTGERVVEYKYFPQIDFFVIDEFYKLSADRDDERAETLNLALYRLLKMTTKFYMLGPNIKSVSSEFIQKYNATWFPTNFATVAVDVITVNKKDSNKKRKDQEKIDIENALFELLESLKEPTLIYCSSPDRANKLALKYMEFISDKIRIKNNFHEDHELIQWIDENIHKEWNLRKTLLFSTGVHHGSLPRHLASTIVDLFNKGEIKYLFCTATLIEGVNTSTKNVVLFDEKKGRKLIDYFDFKNIVGRSGRMSRHFIGKVFQFHPEPDKIEVDVDFPVVTQSNAPIELLVQIESKDLKQTSIDKLKSFESLSEDVKKLLKKNIGVPIEGQLNILRILDAQFDYYYPYMFWSRTPNIDQLEKVIELGWNNLLRKGESRGGARTPKQLAYLTLSSRQKSIKMMCMDMINSDYWIKEEPDKNLRIQKVVNQVLQVTRHWFDYKLPKILTVISEIQSFICKKKGVEPGNYAFFANQIGNHFLPENLAILLEYDVPVSAIKKLAPYIKRDIEYEQMLKKLRNIDLVGIGLLPYEISKIRKLLG